MNHTQRKICWQKKMGEFLHQESDLLTHLRKKIGCFVRLDGLFEPRKFLFRFIPETLGSKRIANGIHDSMESSIDLPSFPDTSRRIYFFNRLSLKERLHAPVMIPVTDPNCARLGKDALRRRKFLLVQMTGDGKKILGDFFRLQYAMQSLNDKRITIRENFEGLMNEPDRNRLNFFHLADVVSLKNS